MLTVLLILGIFFALIALYFLFTYFILRSFERKGKIDLDKPLDTFERGWKKQLKQIKNQEN